MDERRAPKSKKQRDRSREQPEGTAQIRLGQSAATLVDPLVPPPHAQPGELPTLLLPLHIHEAVKNPADCRSQQICSLSNATPTACLALTNLWARMGCLAAMQGMRLMHAALVGMCKVHTCRLQRDMRQHLGGAPFGHTVSSMAEESHGVWAAIDTSRLGYLLCCNQCRGQVQVYLDR